MRCIRSRCRPTIAKIPFTRLVILRIIQKIHRFTRGTCHRIPRKIGFHKGRIILITHAANPPRIGNLNHFIAALTI